MAVNEETLRESRFQASMVLAALGVAIGYKNGEWEFCRSGQRIQEDLLKMGGLK